MGILENESDGRRVTLFGGAVAGRHARCDVELRAVSASNHHASLHWRDDRWFIRDLGSRNGTFVQDIQINTGELVPFGMGNVLSFGGHERWSLRSCSGPSPEVVRLNDGVVTESQGTTLLLPNAERALALITHKANKGWMVEREHGATAVADGAHIDVDGVQYELHLPPMSHSLNSTTRESGPPLTLRLLTFDFLVSSDEESVDLVARSINGEVDLGQRVHHYTLLTLARLRLKHAELPPSERGWAERNELARMLRTSSNTLNQHLFRARQQLDKAGVVEAHRLIETRDTTREIRIGVSSDMIRIRSDTTG
jgi:pSer/pThr/pTyr-binding forkhead associated (FHA) protein